MIHFIQNTTKTNIKMLSQEQRNELQSKLQKHAKLCIEQTQFCKTEEATKQSLILRFFSTLGYNIFNK